jgi:hypothetical protein
MAAKTTPTPGLEDVLGHADRIVTRQIAGECLLVPIAGRGANLDAIYDLNPVGAFIWEHLDGATPGRSVVTALMERFAVELEQATEDYREFAAQLMTIGAVRVLDRERG